MTGLRMLKDASIKKGTRVILRVDFDVVIKNGKIEDDFRIRATAPTIRYLLSRGARLLILTKRGHFKVKRSRALSTRVLIPHLERLCGEKVHFLSGFSQLKLFSASPDEKKVFLFENLRFWPEEEANEPSFAKRFAETAEVYVSDNFGTAHRAHASVVGISKFLPSYAGFLVEREVEALERVIKNQRKPVVAVLGGAKLETKLPVVRRFLKSADKILVGGAIANEILRKPSRKINKKIILPCDGIDNGHGGFEDIGPNTIRLFVSLLRQAKTIVWNGPLGHAEIPEFAKGTKAIARAMARSNAFTVVGGGDTIAILRKYRLSRGFDHVSTGGGAMLEFLAGKKLPGIEVLRK